MRTQFSPPHRAEKSEHDGCWRVWNAAGGCEFEADSRHDAEKIARELDEHATLLTEAQVTEAAFHAALLEALWGKS